MLSRERWGGDLHLRPHPVAALPPGHGPVVPGQCSTVWPRVRTARRVAWSGPVITSVTVGCWLTGRFSMVLRR